MNSQVPDPGPPERRRRRGGYQDRDPRWSEPDEADYPEAGAVDEDPFPPQAAYGSGRHARRRPQPDRDGYQDPRYDRRYPEPRTDGGERWDPAAGYPEPRRARYRGDDGAPGGRTAPRPDQPSRGQRNRNDPPPYPGQARLASPYIGEPTPRQPYRQDPPPGRGRTPDSRSARRSRAYPEDPSRQAYPGDRQQPGGYPPGTGPRRPGDAPPLWQRSSRSGYPGAPERGARGAPDDGYWGMSDPASAAPPRPPRTRTGSSPWDEPGQPAFMGYAEPTYAGPYPEPPTIAIPAVWPTAAPPTDTGQARPAEPAQAAEPVTGTFSILKSSSTMAVGTIASRLTGLVRTLVQAWALGLFAVSNAYNTANTLPNVVYNLALGGILTSVIVPLIVNATKRDRDRGAAYEQRMFTLITAALLGITVVATLAAAPLTDLYKGHIHGAELHLMVIFAYFFIPQIFFYGMSSLIGAVLNTRGSFAAPMWTPVINNVVVIAVLLLFMITAGPLTDPKHQHISGGYVLLVGVGTTLGIVAQTVALIPALRRVGFRWRPRWDFRRSEASEISHMGGWMFCYIAATQVAFLVTTNVANSADPKSGFTAYTYAWQLFQLPYAVVGISVITAVLPRMSGHASEGRFGLVRSDFSAGVRLASAIVVPSSLVLAALGPAMAVLLLGPGASGGLAQARYIGVVFAVFCLGLLPYMLFQLQLRVFYSLHDSKTPALIGLGTMTLNIIANLTALHALPHQDVVAGLGVGFGLANLLGTVVAWRILSRRLRGLDGRAVGGALSRMHAAAIPAALFAVTVGLIVTDAVGSSHQRTVAAITAVVGGLGALALYVMFARALRIQELARLRGMIRGRLGR